MQVKQTQSFDNIPLTYGVHIADEDAPWLTLVIPFALKVDMAEAFFAFFKSHYNLITLEARLFLLGPERELEAGELTVENHAKDILTVLDAESIDKTVLIGYCSGAGIALEAVNQAPERFLNLILVSGEYTLNGQPGCVTQFAQDIDSLLPMAASDMKRAELVLDKIKSSFSDSDSIPKGIEQPYAHTYYFYRYANNYLSYREKDYEKLAASVKHKTFILAGAKDLQVNLQSAEKIKAQIEDATMVVMPQGDHYEILRKDSDGLVQIWNYLSMELVDEDDDF